MAVAMFIPIFSAANQSRTLYHRRPNRSESSSWQAAACRECEVSSTATNSAGKRKGGSDSSLTLSRLLFSVLLWSVFAAAAAGHSFEGFHFRGLAFVALLLHPRIQFVTKFVAYIGQRRVSDQIVSIPRIGDTVVQFLGGAMLVVAHESPRLDIPSGSQLLPRLVGEHIEAA